MKINIIGRQMNVYEDTKELIRSKLSKLDKYFKTEAQATATLSRKRNTSTLEITINASGTLFRSEVGAESFRDALDQSIDAIERQIRKNKTRLAKHLREEAFTLPPEAYEYMAEDYEEEPEVITKVKEFEFRPMTPEDAVTQMNLLEHSFYVFNDVTSGDTCVVYKRRDGSYGLIIPAK